MLVEVSPRPLDVAAHEAAVGQREAGATVSFLGVVRAHDGGREVVELEYQAHPSAAGVLEEIAKEFAALPDVLGVAVSHRVGVLAIGDTALVAAVSTAHRADAFAVCKQLVDEVKQRVPVWKRQVFADGSDEWVGLPD